jgi:rod shape-determining protein MreC
VYDKTVRRRRALLALLVALSLILLTAYFGESAGGGLHSVQRGFLEVVSPIQAGASKALKPVRDLFGWFGDTLHAKGQRDQLRKQVDNLRAQLIKNQSDARQLREFENLFKLDGELKLSDYAPVTARVIARSPTLWYSTVNIDKGSGDGIHVDDPVIDGEGLVGKVSLVTPGASQVTLITDHTSGVSAMVNASGASGVVQPAVGDPNDLILQYLQHGDGVKQGDNVVTSGTVSGRLDSLFPPGIPIGQVTSVDAQDLFKSVHVRPFASLRKLDYLQVLTRGTRGVHPGQVSQAVASLPPPGSGPPGSGSGQGALSQTFASNGSSGGGP